MAGRINTALRNDVAEAYVALLTKVMIYTGAQPASANTAASGTLLATITGLTWQQGANGVWQLAAAANDTADASGTAGWGRFSDAGDTVRFDGLVGAEFTLADTAIVLGGTVTLTAAAVTVPSGE